MPKRRWAIRPCHFFRHLRHRNSACNPFSSAKPRTAGSCPASSSLWKRTSRLAVKPNAALAIWSCFFVHRRLARSCRDGMFGTLAGMVRCRTWPEAIGGVGQKRPRPDREPCGPFDPPGLQNITFPTLNTPTRRLKRSPVSPRPCRATPNASSSCSGGLRGGAASE